jgi:hypothetical protein
MPQTCGGQQDAKDEAMRVTEELVKQNKLEL